VHEPLSLRQGDEPALEVACQVMYADGTTDPIDLTGASVKWVSKPQRADPDSSG
jgi:hypothetical protein